MHVEEMTREVQYYQHKMRPQILKIREHRLLTEEPNYHYNKLKDIGIFIAVGRASSPERQQIQNSVLAEEESLYKKNLKFKQY